MKRLVVILLALLLCLLTLTSALSAVEGVTASDFVAWFEENYPGFVVCETTEYKNRTLILIGVDNGSDMALAIGYTYKKSDIIEFITTASSIDSFTGYFLAAMSDGATPQKRSDDAAIYIQAATADAMSYFSNKWSKANHFGHYYLEINQKTDGSDGIVWIWLHEASKQKNKSTAAGLINSDNYPVLDVITKLNAPVETPVPANTNPAEIVLSSGTWDCPAHIPAGEYSVKPLKDAYVAVWRGEKLISTENLSVKNDDEIGRLVLKDGDRIEISGGKLSFAAFGQD